MNLEPLTALFSSELTSASITILFCAVLALLFLSSLGTLIIHSLVSLKLLRTLNSTIHGITISNSLSRRRDVYVELKDTQRLGKLWQVFDSFLIPSDDDRLNSPYDSSQFFSEQTIAPGVFDNRFLSAVPGFLTAIGVIGTFVGLQIGLSSLTGSEGTGTTPEGLKDGIFSMIAGAAVAFTTSIWGLVTSLSFNMVEKFIQSMLKKKIASLQFTINSIFPPLNAGMELISISQKLTTNTEALSSLDEKIADKLQEAIIETTQHLQEGMYDSLKPALEELARLASSQSQENSHAIMTAISQLNDSGTRRDQEVSQIISSIAETQTSVNTALSESAHNSSEALHSILQDMNNASERFSESSISTTSLLERQADSINKLATLAENAEGFGQMISQLTDKLVPSIQTASENIQQAAKAAQDTHESGSALTQRITDIADSVQTSSNAFLTAATTAENSTQSLLDQYQTLSSALKEHTSQLESHVSQLMKGYANEVDAHTDSRTSAWIEETTQFCSLMTDTVQNLSGLVDAIETKTRAISA